MTVVISMLNWLT